MIDSTNRLPNTLHGLLRVAIDDARKLDRIKYRPVWNQWHEPLSTNRCAVCLAGVVIAGSMGLSPSVSCDPIYFERPVDRKLQALNDMRMGYFFVAWRGLHEVGFRSLTEPSIKAFDSVPIPDAAGFSGWDDFDIHLESLEAIIPALRAVEEKLEPHLQ